MPKIDLKKVANYPSNKLKIFWQSLGPGLVTGAADDDPSGIGTYTIAGARFGTLFLWVAFLTWPLMGAVQMACARVGMVTGQGLAAAIKQKVPSPVMLLICFGLFIANTLNVGANLSAMADCAEMLGGGSSHFYVLFFGIGTAAATIYLPYVEIARVLKWLALFLFSYIFTVFMVGPDWSEALLDTIRPQWPYRNEQWQTLVAILGTTISPYLFFWQSSQEVEEEKATGRKALEKRIHATQQELLARKFDVGVGTFFSNIVMYFVILAAALTLYKNDIRDIQTSRQAAEALAPIAGKFASLLYSLGLIGVGFLAIPVLTVSASYALADTFGWNQGLDAKFNRAKAFYSVILASTFFAIVFDYADINPIQGLFWSGVLNGLLAPFLLLTIFLVIRDAKIMRGQPSSKLTQFCVMTTTILMFLAAIGMFLL